MIESKQYNCTILYNLVEKLLKHEQLLIWLYSLYFSFATHTHKIPRMVEKKENKKNYSLPAIKLIICKILHNSGKETSRNQQACIREASSY